MERTDGILERLCSLSRVRLEAFWSVLDGFGRIVADLNDFVGFEWISMHLGDLGFTIWLDLGGSGHLCRFGWSCPDSLRLDLKRVLLHFDLSGCGQDLCVFVGFVWIWVGFERIPLDSS